MFFLLNVLIDDYALQFVIKMRHHLTHLFRPFRSECMQLGILVIHVMNTSEHIHIAEPYGTGARLIAHGNLPRFIPFHRSIALDVRTQSRVNQDIGQHMGQTVTERKQDTRNGCGNLRIGRHTEIVRKQDIITQAVVITHLGIIALVSRQQPGSLHLGYTIEIRPVIVKL